MIETLNNVKTLEESLGWDHDWSAKLPEAEQFLVIFQQKAAQAAFHNELPTDIGDAQQTNIAKQTLSKAKYEVGPLERLIVNSKRVPRDRVDTRVFNGKLETTIRKWEEFQVCTVEKEGKKYFVYFNTLKNFSRGPATTPIDEWILSNRFKSGEIAADKLK